VTVLWEVDDESGVGGGVRVRGNRGDLDRGDAVDQSFTGDAVGVYHAAGVRGFVCADLFEESEGAAMTILAVANQKGGVGKTTTAVTLADIWARGGARVLLIDLDGQGNVADSLGLRSGNELAYWLAPGMGRWQVVEGRKNLDVIRADKTTSELKAQVAGMMFRERVIERGLEGKIDGYDLVIMDCAPSLDLLHVAALVAAEWLLIPTRLDQLAIKGVRDVISSAVELKRMKATRVEFAGVLPTFFERQTKESLAQLENLMKVFSSLVLPPIPTDTSVREANRAGKTILEFNGKARALMGIDQRGGYLQVVKELELRIG
jgi:chromosome partitioning protein